MKFVDRMYQKPINFSMERAKKNEHVNAAGQRTSGESSTVSLHVVTRMRSASPVDRLPPLPLTCRERDVLEAVATGRSNCEIAQLLFIAENTVKFHLKNIYSKLAVTNRVQAIQLAMSLRLLQK